MRKAAVILTLLMLHPLLWAQAAKPSHPKGVSFSAECKLEGVDTLLITFKGKIAEGWHIYSLDDSPVVMPTSFVIDSINGAEPVGVLQADVPAENEYSPVFKCNIGYYKGSVTFSQRIHLTGGKYIIEAHLGYQACNQDKCLAPDSVPISYTGEVCNTKF